jgi:hypothetical protein
MAYPLSWEEVNACDCAACQALTEIYLNGHNSGEFLFVCDARMYGAGFVVADLRHVFVGTAAQVRDLEVSEAVAIVLDKQRHCDVFLSSFPELHGKDFLWRCDSYLNAKLEVAK